MNQESPSQELVPLKKRRTRIPDKPNYSLNLWSIMKNCIGKELSKIPMPVSSSYMETSHILFHLRGVEGYFFSFFLYCFFATILFACHKVNNS